MTSLEKPNESWDVNFDLNTAADVSIRTALYHLLLLLMWVSARGVPS